MRGPNKKTLIDYIENICKHSVSTEKTRRIPERTLDSMRAFFYVLGKEFQKIITSIESTNQAQGWIDLDLIRHSAMNQSKHMELVTHKKITCWLRRFLHDCNQALKRSQFGGGKNSQAQDQFMIINRRHSKIRALQYSSKQLLECAVAVTDQVVSILSC